MRILAVVRLGLGSYKTAWLLLHKLRRAMVNPERTMLAGIVEVDDEGKPMRLHLEPIQAYSRATLQGFVDRIVEQGIAVVTDGLSAYQGMTNHEHRHKVVGRIAAHVLLPWIHRVF